MSAASALPLEKLVALATEQIELKTFNKADFARTKREEAVTKLRQAAGDGVEMPSAVVELVVNMHTQSEKRKLRKAAGKQKMAALAAKIDELQRMNETLLNKNEKLANLCRELQERNKKAVEDFARMTTAEREAREQQATRVDELMGNLQKQIDKDRADRELVETQNNDLRSMAAKLIEQTRLVEDQHNKQVQVLELEKKLAEAKLAETVEKFQPVIAALKERDAECVVHKQTNEHLREQLRANNDRFEELSKQVRETTTVLSQWSKEKKKMLKNQGALATENARLEKTNMQKTQLLYEMAEKLKRSEEFAARAERLENLCRMLQDERKTLQAQITELKGGAGDDAATADATTGAAGIDEIAAAVDAGPAADASSSSSSDSRQ